VQSTLAAFVFPAAAMVIAATQVANRQMKLAQLLGTAQP
jgi:hypothetical protein